MSPKLPPSPLQRGNMCAQNFTQLRCGHKSLLTTDICIRKPQNEHITHNSDSDADPWRACHMCSSAPLPSVTLAYETSQTSVNGQQSRKPSISSIRTFGNGKSPRGYFQFI